MTERYLVTGCAGFIASKVADLLLGGGHRVVGVDNLNDAYDPRLKHWRLARCCRNKNFRFHRVDIARPGGPAGALRGRADATSPTRRPILEGGPLRPSSIWRPGRACGLRSRIPGSTTRRTATAR